MDFLTIILGLLVIAYGAYGFYARARKTEQLGKLEAMKARWGNRGGLILHTVSYSIMPILIGSALVFAGLNGISILELLTA